MRVFNQEIVTSLDAECNGDPIHFVGLGIFDFRVVFGRLGEIRSNGKIVFFLGGQTYEWSEGPTDLPVWRIVSQVPQRFELRASSVLRMWLLSGDYVDFFTDEGPYENVIVEFAPRDGKRVMEIF